MIFCNFALKTNPLLWEKYLFKFSIKRIRHCATLCTIARAGSLLHSSSYLRTKYSSYFGLHKVTFCCCSIEMDVKHLTCTPEWNALQDYYNKFKHNLVISELFKSDPKRFDTFRYFNFFIFKSSHSNFGDL